MDVTIINVEDYQNRMELETYIRNEIGDDIPSNRKSGIEIHGSSDKLKSIGLSETTRVYGIKVVINS